MGIFVAEIGEALVDGGHQDGEALGDRLRFTGKIDDETVAADTGGGARQDGGGHFLEGGDAQDFAETGQFFFEDGEGGLGSDIAGPDAGTAGGDDEITAALVGQFAQGFGDAFPVIGEHDRFDFHVGAEDLAQDVIDSGPAPILVDPGAGAVAKGDPSDFHVFTFSGLPVRRRLLAALVTVPRILM